MKLDSNNKMISNDCGTETPDDVTDPRQNVEDIIDFILTEFTESRNPDATRNTNGTSENIIQPQTRTPANSLSENTILDDLDPSSNLSPSIRDKCLELEEILQTLKTQSQSRLNHVVLEENIVLSPEANSLEAQLEHDLDTDCQEDLSLQEFLEILQSQNKINPTSVQ